MTPTDEEEESIYCDPDHKIASTPLSDKLIIMGDFNARVGRGTTWRQVIEDLEIGSENSNGLLLLGECIKHELAITNTRFRQSNKKKTSWMNPRSKRWHLLDYVIVRQRDVSDVRITTAMRGADCGTDYRMIRSNLLLELQPRRRKSAAKPMKRLNVKLLRDGTTQAQLFDNIEASLPPEDETYSTVEEEWAALRDAVYKASLETLGTAKRRHEYRFDENDVESPEVTCR